MMRIGQPAFEVVRILDGSGESGHFQRAESIHHHGEFTGFFGADAFLHRAGVRAVRNAAGVQRDLAALHVIAAHEVAIYVIQHLVAVDVAVVVRCGDGLWVVVVEPRHKRADNKGLGLKSLVDGWRQVYPAGYGFEVVDGKGVRIDKAIPSHEVERVAEIEIRINLVLLFYVNQKLALLVVCLQVCGFADVPLAKRRVLEQLAEVVAVSFGGGDGTGAFHDEQSVFFTIKFQLVGGTPRHDEVVAVREFDAAVHGAQGAGAFVHENHFVGVGIFEKIVSHAFAGGSQHDFAVVVHQHGLAAFQIIVFGGYAKTLQAAVFQLFVRNDFRSHGIRFAHLHDLRGRVAMVQQRIEVAEPLGGEEFLVVQLAIWLSELGVAGRRNLPQGMVVHNSVLFAKVRR